MGPFLNLPPSLTDGVIRLDAPTVADAEAHVAGEDREIRLRFESPDPDVPATLERAREVFAGWMATHASDGPTMVYAVRTPSNQLAGGCEMRHLAAGGAAVSYWIYLGFRRQGYGARALALLCAAAQDAKLMRLEARIDPDNLASCRTAEASGFIDNGLTEDQAQDGQAIMRRLYVRTP